MEIALPPLEYMRLVGGDQPDVREHFDSVGSRLVRRMESVDMLESGARILDVGCGCGRIARHLVDYPIAAYCGFDRHRGMIDWASAHIGAVDDRFEFQHVDVESGYTELDSDMGTISASEFDFPYESEAFTGMLAASVFTHMDFPGTSHYLGETGRVMAPGGRVLGSFFAGESTGSLEGSGWNFTIREKDLTHAIEHSQLEVVLMGIAGQTTDHSWFLLEKPQK